VEASRGVNEAGSSADERQKPTGFTRVFRAFGNSLKGFAGAFREEAAFRQELALALLIVPLGVYLGHNGIERALLIAPMLLVLIVELLNSAIEATVDRVGLERHRLSGLAKDIGSAAVLLSFVLLVTVWVLVLFDR
jgi:diacylglycerol kinase (ATP)